jgi:hypothetical protein
MSREYGSLLSPGFITAVTKLQGDYPIWARSENDELLKLFSGFDSYSLSVVAQLTIRTISNTDKQKRLLAGENVWICH